jgi:hypothetical protein
MGEIADGLINGDFDFHTGEYIGKGGGFPRTKAKTWGKKNFTLNGKVAIEGVQKSLYNKLGIRGKETVAAIVNEYLPGDGTLKQKCLEIQKDWNKFCQWINAKIKEANTK